MLRQLLPQHTNRPKGSKITRLHTGITHRNQLSIVISHTIGIYMNKHLIVEQDVNRVLIISPVLDEEQDRPIQIIATQLQKVTKQKIEITRLKVIIKRPAVTIRDIITRERHQPANIGKETNVRKLGCS